MYAMTTHGSHPFADSSFTPGDWFVFGAKAPAFPKASATPSPRRSASACLCGRRNRSLNLSNAVAVTVFEAWRQNGYDGGI